MKHIGQNLPFGLGDTVFAPDPSTGCVAKGVITRVQLTMADNGNGVSIETIYTVRITRPNGVVVFPTFNAVFSSAENAFESMGDGNG